MNLFIASGVDEAGKKILSCKFLMMEKNDLSKQKKKTFF